MSEEVGLPEERHEHGGRARHHALLRRATHVPAGTLTFLNCHRREIITVRGQSYVSRLPKY